MTNRVLLDTTSLKISKAGVDVLTAGSIDLLFNSNAASFPIVTKATVQLVNAFNTVTTINFGRTFPAVPFVALFYSASIPTITTTMIVIHAMSADSGVIAPTDYNPSSGDYTYFNWQIYNNRIEMKSTREHSTGAASNPLTGYVTAIIYDFW